ncbi:MAG: transposase [Firmicutes bacterium]|nr:transposase [Alicyclobacillaceae bacterium]MCL6497328.1 transposase [Bacillota bacterium]
MVDHERGTILNILPDTRAETVAARLRAHPTVAIGTRDRAVAFAHAIAEGVPQAQQVVDRFHLFRNLADAVERFFQRHPEPLPPSEPLAAPEAPTEPLNPCRSQARWAAIHARLAQRDNLSAIARALNLDRHPVPQYVRMPAPPASAVPQRRRCPQEDRWAAVFEAVWVAGHHTPTALYVAARTQGYTGSRSPVYRWLVARHGRHGTRRRPSPPRRPAPWRPRRWATACLRRWTTLPRATTERLSMRLQDPEVRRVGTLVHQFRVLVRASARGVALPRGNQRHSGIGPLCTGPPRGRGRGPGGHSGAVEPRTHGRAKLPD